MTGRRAYVLVEGRQTNVAGGDGHPVEIMDLSFSVQALATHLLARGGLEPGLHSFPAELDREIALTKLATLGLSLAEPTEKQREFEARWSDLEHEPPDEPAGTRARRVESAGCAYLDGATRGSRTSTTAVRRWIARPHLTRAV